MELDDSHTGPESIQASIDMLNTKTEMLERVKELTKKLDEKADVTVINSPDSSLVEVDVRAEEPLDEIKRLAEIDKMLQGEAHRAEDILYDYENEMYKLSIKFRTNY